MLTALIVPHTMPFYRTSSGLGNTSTTHKPLQTQRPRGVFVWRQEVRSGIQEEDYLGDQAVTTCFICGGVATTPATADYERCAGCGVERLAATGAQQFMVNDYLDESEIRAGDSTMTFQRGVTQDVAANRGVLIDVGCGSGRFLLHAKPLFSHVYGVEVSPPSIAFATGVLGLDVKPELPDAAAPVSVATFWHSLEHIPADQIPSILTRLLTMCDGASRIVIAVPNTASWQYQWLKSRYAYYDVPHHLHQFSTSNLLRLMATYGYTPTEQRFSFAYSGFGWAQGLLNLFNRTHNYFYYRRKRRYEFGMKKDELARRDFVNLALLPFVLPVAGVLTILERVFSREFGATTIVFKPA